MKKTFIAMALGSAFTAAHATDMDFSGYLRAGTGVNTRGGTQTCFKLPNADTKWRLGNECDYTIEPNIESTVAKLEDGSEWRVHFMPSVYRAWGDTEAGTNELTTRFGQAYGFGRNIPQLAGGTVWAGRRFYNRVQLGINDQFLENNDGDGAGIENMDFGFTKFSFAFMMNGRLDANDNRYTIPLRFSNIKTFKDSDLDIHIGYQAQTSSKNQVTNTTPANQPDGQSLGLYHVTHGTLGGDTFVGLRYDNNDAARGAINQKNSRIVLQQTGYLPKMETGWDFITEYRVNKVKDGIGNKWYSIGGRTDTHITGPFRFLVELGHDRIKPDSGATQNLTKLTLATAISAGKDPGSRPTVRLFYTYAKWNEAARVALANGGINEQRAQQVFGDKTSGSSIGAQLEAWW